MRVKWKKINATTFTALNDQVLMEKEPHARSGEPGAWLLAVGEEFAFFRTKAEAEGFLEAIVKAASDAKGDAK